ncbi:1-deoxy-D-xylulose-5-phosphate synthase [Kribbella sp. VKM Ac-2568]|uniref:1-deoxy-D-xylulose-5-phosphate synthase n=1 Tax=Kribbella sp. VKM Ac-2568 TaxID=2512219 RepID=UPI00104E2604|nr:1-deoxy-D-xylulose-5-phosphate synthase [Kribbella sp. VKM Ac-2568]TCM34577.1 1-deoxy-D-xylulose-5-phosphate synthase [Kribbella sp. VKM Ac-2568]
MSRSGVDERPRPNTGLLDTLASPADLRRLPAADLCGLADEIREQLVRHVTRTGGHLGPNLGVVELTIALHRVFTSPQDVIVWDTGHQTYVHKMLTGRLGRFDTLRQAGGLSGYPSRSESEHDIIENSHASTALSYADGLAKGFQLTGSLERRVVAIVGDGAMTGGMCWEALNNIAAAPDRPVVIVLNDNGRSYESTVGSLAVQLRALRTGTARGNVFEQLGLAYLGPVDGHDILALEAALRTAALLQHPVVVHCLTRKGAGHAPAELDEADHHHTVNPARADVATSQVRGPVWTDVFGQELVAIADERKDVVAVTAAMVRPTGLFPLACRYPERVFDVGIAEQHAVTSAVGLAVAGLHPVVAIYSTFLNRAFDQVLMDAALHRAPITFVLDRSGITGPDGPSHHGMWDLALCGLVPGMQVAAPRDAQQLRLLLRTCVDHQAGPTMLRFPRGRSGAALRATGNIGAAELLTDSRPEGLAAGQPEVLLLPVGPLAAAAVDASHRLRELRIRTTVVDPRWIIPIEPELVRFVGEHRLVVTIEDNTLPGGFGDALARALRRTASRPEIITLGLPGEFAPAGERADLLHTYGLDAEGITHAVAGAV